MKALLLYCIIFYTACNVFAQEILRNPSFEANCACGNPFPSFLTQYNCAVWDTAVYTSIIDLQFPGSYYMNSCNKVIDSCKISFSAPYNSWGYEMPHNGNAYIGIYTYNNPNHSAFPNYNMFVTQQLNNKLVKDAVYSISLFVSLADRYGYDNNSLQVLFNNEIPYLKRWPKGGAINLEDYAPQVDFQKLGYKLHVKNGWQQIKGTYKADGTEDRMTIGNFKFANHSDTVYNGTGKADNYCGYYWDASFYFIDDVSLTLGIDAGRDTLLCKAESSTKLTASPGWQHYKWSTGDTGISITVNKAGTYIVAGTVDSLPNYSKTDTVVVFKSSMPSKLLEQKDTTIYIGDTLHLQAAEGFMQYNWSTGESTQSIVIFNSQSSILNYAVTVYTSEGCMLTDTIHITFKEKPKEVELPIIVPNPQYIGKTTAFKVLNLPQGSMAYLYNGVGQNVSNALQRTTFFTEGIYYYLLVLPSGKVVKGKVLLLKE